MEFSYNNFDIIIELLAKHNTFKLKVYDNNTNKYYQNIFDDTNLNYKTSDIYKLLIDIISDNDDLSLIHMIIEDQSIDIHNILIIKLYYNNNNEIMQDLIVYEVSNM